MIEPCTPSAILEAVRGLHVADPDLGPKPLLAKLREQQPDLGAGNKEVREALTALKAEREATEAAAAAPPAAAAAARHHRTYAVRPAAAGPPAAGEFGSVAAALAAARADGARHRTVLFKPGTHYLNATVVLTPADSGTSFTAELATGESATVSGGLELSGLSWTAAPGAAAGVQVADVPVGLPATAAIFVDRARYHRARYPNGPSSQGTATLPGARTRVHVCVEGRAAPILHGDSAVRLVQATQSATCSRRTCSQPPGSSCRTRSVQP